MGRPPSLTARVLFVLTDIDRAIALTREGIKMVEDACGEFHPELQNAREFLTEMLNQAGSELLA
jgi:hypothetical protein